MSTSFTPEQIEQFLQEFFTVVGRRQYIGARYVPLFGRKDEESIAWDNSKPYEPLTIVLHEGNSYTSRTYVPTGIDIDNETYWALTGNYNAQVEAYRQEVARVESIMETKPFNFDTVADMQSSDFLFDGATCHTNGFHSVNDGGSAWYIISDTGVANGMDVIACGNFYAYLIKENGKEIIPEMYGADGTGASDCSSILNYIFALTERFINFRGFYRCESNVYIPNTHPTTINGIHYNDSAMRFVDNAHLIIGGANNTNELRINNITIHGDGANNDLVYVSHVQNIFFSQVNIVNSGKCLIKFDTCGIIFIKDSTLSGSNANNVYWPCDGIELVDSNPLYVESCNIWNLNKVIKVNGSTEEVTLKGNWIEFCNIHIYDNSKVYCCVYNYLENMFQGTLFNPNETYANSRLILIDSPSEGYNSILNVKNNSIIYYSGTAPQYMVEIKNVNSAIKVNYIDNVNFIRLSSLNSYAVGLTSAANVTVFYSSINNQDLDYGCNVATRVIVNNTGFNDIHRQLSVVSPNKSDHNSGEIFYDNEYYAVDRDGNVRRMVISKGAGISLIPDPSTVSSETIATKVNAIISQMTAAGLSNLLS